MFCLQGVKCYILTIIKRRYGCLSINKLKINNILIEKTPINNASVEGWVRSVRHHKKAVFVDVNDGSTIKSFQVVLDPSKFKSEISYGASVRVTGNIVETKMHRDGIEMHGENVTVIGPCNEGYPFIKNADYYARHLRAFPHLRPKEDDIAALLRTRNTLEMTMHSYFQERKFIHIHTPLVTSSDCEGAGETFRVVSDVERGVAEDDVDAETSIPETKQHENDESNEHFFGKPVYLSVSGQLHLEACALGVGNVYTLSPVFRAEGGSSKKHLSEFRMLEVEIPFTESLDDIIYLMEDSIKYFLKTCFDKCQVDLEHCHRNLPDDHRAAIENAINKKYLRMTYNDSLEVIKSQSKKLKTFVPSWGDDFNNDHEAVLMEHTGNLPLFVTDFPSHAKPFYMLQNSDGKTVDAVDLIFPFCGELSGGSAREHRIDVLTERLDQLGMRDRYEWYLDLRRYGGAPHSGYGLGFDRFVRFLLGINNIRDAVPFPRSVASCML